MRVYRKALPEEVKVKFNPNANEVKANIEQKLSRLYGASAADATREQMYKATVGTIKDILAEKSSEYGAEVRKQGGKKVYYNSTVCVI